MNEREQAQYNAEKESNESNYDRLLVVSDKLNEAYNENRRLRQIIRMVQEEITVTVEDNHYRQVLLDRIATEMNGVEDESM